METIGGILMFKYILNYDGGFLRDSADLGYTFETEEEAKEDAEMEIESRISDWEIDTQALKELTSQTNVKTYILSAVEIRNASDIGLDCIQEFDQPDSYRHIYLYNIL